MTLLGSPNLLIIRLLAQEIVIICFRALKSKNDKNEGQAGPMGTEDATHVGLEDAIEHNHKVLTAAI